MNLINDISEFTAYCNDFYNDKNGIYPIASTEKITEAIAQYITQPRQIPLEFDSIDRELVRKILQPNYIL